MPKRPKSRSSAPTKPTASNDRHAGDDDTTQASLPKYDAKSVILSRDPDEAPTVASGPESIDQKSVLMRLDAEGRPSRLRLQDLADEAPLPGLVAQT